MIRLASLAAILALASALAWAPATASAQAVAQHAAEKLVRFPGHAEEPGDLRGEFAGELLALVLERANEGHRLQVVGGMGQPRRIRAAHDGLVDVVVLPHQAEAQSQLIAVRLPLRRGLLGVRLLLARPETAQRLMTVGSLAELKQGFVMGYGATWLDREVMAGLGFRMMTGSSYAGLFDMLRAGRFDYLSRGVNEIEAEMADPRLGGSGLEVVPGIALYYPLDDYFYVTPERPELARSIERGFRRALADGTYAALFHRHFHTAMRDARLDERSIIHVSGYPVPPGTPLEAFDVLGLVRSSAVFNPPPVNAPR